MSASYAVVVGPILNLLGKVLGKAIGERPTLEVSPERFLGGATVFMYLKVHNPMLHKVHVLNINVEPRHLRVWKDSSVGAAADAQIGGEPEFILETGETKLLPLLAINRRDDGIEDTARFTLRWRSHRHPRRWKLPVWLHLTHDDHDRMKRAG